VKDYLLALAFLVVSTLELRICSLRLFLLAQNSFPVSSNYPQEPLQLLATSFASPEF